MEIEKANAAIKNVESWFSSANSNYRDGNYSASL